MRNFSIFLFVFSLCILGYVIGAGIKITNDLKSNKLLWMRCYSKDDVLGPKTLRIGEHYLACFEPNFWGTTRFMCTLRQGPNYKHHQNFTAFKLFTFELFSMMDDGCVWDWRARENGIYLEKNNEKLHKVYDWMF
ncbi:unnamed protein product [Cochlearia groenlandica]